MSELYIAEKKDIADAIASYIWPDGQFEKRLSGKGNGYYRQGDTFVSWAKGHVLALVNPDAYGQQFLKWEEYRCFPQQWLLYSPADKKDQFNILRELLKTKYDTLYHCGDADREGQLLIDEILQVGLADWFQSYPLRNGLCKTFRLPEHLEHRRGQDSYFGTSGKPGA